MFIDVVIVHHPNLLVNASIKDSLRQVYGIVFEINSITI